MLYWCVFRRACARHNINNFNINSLCWTRNLLKAIYLQLFISLKICIYIGQIPAFNVELLFQNTCNIYASRVIKTIFYFLADSFVHPSGVSESRFPEHARTSCYQLNWICPFLCLITIARSMLLFFFNVTFKKNHFVNLHIFLKIVPITEKYYNSCFYSLTFHFFCNTN